MFGIVASCLQNFWRLVEIRISIPDLLSEDFSTPLAKLTKPRGDDRATNSTSSQDDVAFSTLMQG
jgi:hypothetical protein